MAITRREKTITTNSKTNVVNFVGIVVNLCTHANIYIHIHAYSLLAHLPMLLKKKSPVKQGSNETYTFSHPFKS